ncbi:unnamed protein product [Arabidopsis halleri]
MSNSATNKEPPHKKRKTSPSPPDLSWSPLSSLPDEMILSCLARVSRLDQAALSIVSKPYRSLMASPELYKTRSELGCAENCLYVCLLTPPDPTPRWFILRRGETLNRLSPIPSLSSQSPEASSVVVMDWGIYVIGGFIKETTRTSDVWLLDCRSHTWCQVPSMGVARACAAVGVVNGKIYVFGGCLDPDSSNWAEVFDPKTQTWESLPPMPDRTKRNQYIHDSVVVREDKIFAVDAVDRTYCYSPSEGKWGRGNDAPTQGNTRDWCVIDNLIFCMALSGSVYWCAPDQLEREPEGMYWRKVEGLVSLKKRLSSSRLVHFDGKMEALWESYKITIGRDKKLIDLLPGTRLSKSGSNVLLLWDVIEGDHLEIWCAEISLERRQGPEIWGSIEWSNAVMTVDPFLHHYKVGALLKCFQYPGDELSMNFITKYHQ